MKRKTPYSREFPFTATSKRYLLDGIPPGLWRTFRARCRRDGVSVRTRLLTLVKTDSSKS